MIFMQYDSGDGKFDFLCEEDFHDKIKPPTWDAALQKLKGEYANDMIITAFVEVMHYAVISTQGKEEFCCEIKLITVSLVIQTHVSTAIEPSKYIQ